MLGLLHIVGDDGNDLLYRLVAILELDLVQDIVAIFAKRLAYESVDKRLRRARDTREVYEHGLASCERMTPS